MGPILELKNVYSAPVLGDGDIGQSDTCLWTADTC